MWYVNALYMAGRVDESRKLFEEVLSCCNGCGTVGETIDPKTRYTFIMIKLKMKKMWVNADPVSAAGSCGVTSLTP